MKKHHQSRRGSERGIALLIAIFVLLLISVVAIALLVSSGTETALGANYRSSSAVYYAALAGLEEARGRLLQKNPNSIASYNGPGLLPSTNTTVYILNPSSGENVTPWDSSNSYYDNEYQNEFGVPVTTTQQYQIPSVWVGNTYPGPMYKWVRINAITEKSIFTDVNNDGVKDNSTPLFYDPANLASGGTPWPSLIVNTSPPSTAVQALEITAFAQLPNGSKKMLQYLVAPVITNLTFPAALTVDGYSNAYTFSNHNSNPFQINGNDSHDSACSATMPNSVPAIGVPDSTDASNIINAINSLGPPPGSRNVNYQGSVTPNPSVGQMTFGTNLQTVQSLNQLVQYITQNADAVIQGPADQSSLPSAMSSSNPMTVVITGDPTQPSQGNFSLGSNFTGYGLLVVTGTLTYDSSASWNGVILVIGQGKLVESSTSTLGALTGAVLLAQTRDSSGNLLSGPQPGRATFDYTGKGSIVYSCSQIQAAQAPLTYKVLSFHEIPQP